VNAFYPEQIKENDFIPPVYLTSLKQGGEELRVDKALEKLEEITLDWQNNFFEFEYVALNYTHPENNQYAYMLEGVDKDWYFAGTRRFGRYTGLDSGEYTLCIKGSNNDGLWNEQGVSIKVTVTPPWWQTWWFRGGLGLLLVGLVVGGASWRVRSVENRRRQLEQQVAEKTVELQQSNEALTQAKKEAESAREKADIANQAKSQFLSNMSHELRTPLNGILGYAQILKRGHNLTTVQADGLNIIQQSGNHLLTLINDILDLAKIEAGKLDLYPTNFHLPSFLQSIAGIIRMRANQKDLLFSYESLSPLPSGIQADEKRLRQILLNLLGNAVKFTNTGYVTLNVTALSAPSERTVSAPLQQIETGQIICLRFQVLDTGVGMTTEQLEKIFLPFEQVGDIQRRAEGTGLGLSISRQLVEAMDSRLQVESTPGEGSIFWFDLTCPTVDVEADVTIGPKKKIVGYQGDRCKILIADDKDYNRLVLVNLLEPLGFQTVTANDGREAVEKARQFDPDLILTDVVMPVMTGIEAVLEMRQIPALQDVPIIAVSASVLKEDRHQTKLAGCNDFLGKPVNAERLFAMLANYLTLEWIYQAPSATLKQPDSDTLDLIPPPPEQLAALLNLSRRGNMQEIAQQAAQIAQMGEQYRPFAHLLEQLARGYQVKKVQNLIKRYAGEE
ncbi:MAG: response regulator, partial [Chloroflexi bacterium]|nr:response regulator [Chloroflexota bacterium]